MADSAPYLRCPECGYTDTEDEFPRRGAMRECPDCEYAATEQVFADAYTNQKGQ